MKETKVYMSKLPESCEDCPCYNFDVGGCQCQNVYVPNDEINRFNGCPLIDIKTHDREVVKEVCEKIRSELEKELKYDFTSYVPIMNVCNKINRVLDQIQKEYEK